MAQQIDLAQRLEFLGVTEEDRRCLASLRPILEKQADQFVAAFYRRLLEFEPTRALLSDARLREDLVAKQREYLLSLAGPEINEAYVRDRIRIGEQHAQVGLEPSWYLGAYVLYLRLLIPAIRKSYRGDSAVADRTIFALLKILVLDADIAVQAYIQRRERELEHLNRELARATTVIRREYEEKAAELERAAERARAAEDLASSAKIIAGLAHEIGTPMGVIQGYAEALEAHVTEESGRVRLRTIRDQIDRISHVMRTLLSIAEPRQHGWSRVNLRDAIERTISFLEDRFARAGVRVERDLDLRAMLRGNLDSLQQLFLNLFLNAVDAMPEGGRLRVSMTREDAGKVAVHIADTGQGMPPEIRARIFEPFFTTKPAGKGNGLGLMVAARIVQEHGGKIDVESGLDRGTEFRVTLPCERL